MNVIPLRQESAVEPARPFIDGKPFCDLWGIPAETRAALIERGLVWLTAFTRRGHEYGGTIIAGSWGQAEQIASARRLGEIVIGQLAEEIAA